MKRLKGNKTILICLIAIVSYFISKNLSQAPSSDNQFNQSQIQKIKDSLKDAKKLSKVGDSSGVISEDVILAADFFKIEDRNRQKIIHSFSIGSDEDQLGVYEENGIKVGPGAFSIFEDNLIIQDTINNAVKIFGLDGELQDIIHFSEETSLKGLSTNEDGEIRVLKEKNNRLYIDAYSQTGKKLDSIEIKTKKKEILYFGGTFETTTFGETTHLHDEVAGTFKIEKDGTLTPTPGRPVQERNDLFVDSERNSDGSYRILFKDKNNETLKSFETSKFQTIENMTPNKDGTEVTIEFSHFEEPTEDHEGGNIKVIEKYSDDGTLIERQIINDKNEANTERNSIFSTDGKSFNSLITSGDEILLIHGFMS